jgi:hypothetical protein
MGKATLIGAVATLLISSLMIYNTQLVSRETDGRQFDHMREQVARELALAGRKLVLAHWVESQGESAVRPFESVERDGGTITVSDYALVDGVLDFTVRAAYDSVVHEVRSRYRWNNYIVNPLQIKATDLHLDISPDATLDIASISLDDQSIQELDEVLIQELQLGGSLSEFDLSMEQMETELRTKLDDSGNGDIAIEIIDQSARDILDQQNGLFFPDQVQQAIDAFIASNPSAFQILNINALNGDPTPSLNPEKEVYKIEEDVTLESNLTGEGILIIEGSFVVPEGVSFNWDGMVIVKPSSSDTHVAIDFQGNVNLSGSLIALQEAIPNSGHMDVTVFRDMTGNWSSPYGNEFFISGWNWCAYHTHDFTSLFGNSVRLYGPTAAARPHETRVRFHSTMTTIGAGNEVYLKIKNPAAHGRGTLTMELSGEERTTYPVAPGFDPNYASEADLYQSATFDAGDLQWLNLDITRLSALKKMWDDSDNPFAGCTLGGGILGPYCVAQDYNRYEALTLQLYQVDGLMDRLVYEASLYWHRREDEEEEFEEEMEALVSELQSSETGLSITFGSNVTFIEDTSVIATLGAFGGLPLGVAHLGTWHVQR